MGKSEAGKAESGKSSADDLTGRRILITGAARNIGSSLARRLYDRGASVGLLGLEPELLEQVATSCGRAPWQLCDVADLEQVSRGVDYIAEKLGGIDVVVANAGVEANSSILGGDPADMRRAVEVNLMGTYYTLRAAGPHISHENGYALVVASAHGAAKHPFRGPFGASRAGVEALGDALRLEMKHLGTKVGVAYIGDIDTDTTALSFDGARGTLASAGTTTVADAVDAFERGIVGRKSRVHAPRRSAAVRHIAQRAIDLRPSHIRGVA